MQIGLQLLDLAVWAMGEHADRAHTDHNLAGWWTLWQPRSQPPGEAPVNPDHPPIPERRTERQLPLPVLGIGGAQGIGGEPRAR